MLPNLLFYQNKTDQCVQKLVGCNITPRMHHMTFEFPVHILVHGTVIKLQIRQLPVMVSRPSVAYSLPTFFA